MFLPASCAQGMSTSTTRGWLNRGCSQHLLCAFVEISVSHDVVDSVHGLLMSLTHICPPPDPFSALICRPYVCLHFSGVCFAVGAILSIRRKSEIPGLYAFYEPHKRGPSERHFLYVYIYTSMHMHMRITHVLTVLRFQLRCP